jgi:Mrp family chromosome partitioning ATPase/capsular polysaccharide biosynthesis protein
MAEGFGGGPTTAADYVAVLRRRRWIIILVPLLAAVLAYAVSTTQRPVYRATADVLVNRSNVVSAIANISDPTVVDPARFLTTVASMARSPVLSARVVKAVPLPGLTPTKLLDESSVDPSPNADVLRVSVSERSSDHAIRLANAYASEFTRYKTELDTARINAAVRSLNVRLTSLRAHGQAASPAYATLIQYQGALATIGKLLAENTTVLQRAETAAKVHPRPRRNAILAGLLGAVLGFGLAFLAEALDRRVRSEADVEETLAVPLLARLPKPPREHQRSNKLVMLAEPTGVDAESIRKLRTSIEFVNLDRASKTIMVTSAVEREGKSTTVANLAIAFARAGRRVILVDLDLRRPSLHQFLDATMRPGFTDVVVERADVGDAVRVLPLPPIKAPPPAAHMNGGRRVSEWDGRRGIDAVLHFLPAGTLPPSPGEFLEDERVSTVLDRLSEQFDLVLIDAPPLLAVGDAIALSGRIDAVFAVVRMTMVRQPVVRELARELQSFRSAVLGFVLTGIDRGDSYGYVYEAYTRDVRRHAERGGERV